MSTVHLIINPFTPSTTSLDSLELHSALYRSIVEARTNGTYVDLMGGTTQGEQYHDGYNEDDH